MQDHHTYHQATYDLLDQPAAHSAEAEGRIAAREHQLGSVFPAAVREWYAREDSIEILLACGIADEPYCIEHLGKLPEQDELNPRPAAFYAPSMLRFMIDNHGGVAYAFHLDGSEDPPVYTWDDDQAWHRQGDTFSRYLFILAWSALAEQAAYHRSAFSAPLAPAGIRLLRDELEEVPPGLRDSLVRRFQREDQRLEIAPYATNTLHWYLSAESAGGLEALATTVQRCDSLRTDP